jgi:hypothetical protein
LVASRPGAWLKTSRSSSCIHSGLGTSTVSLTSSVADTESIWPMPTGPDRLRGGVELLRSDVQEAPVGDEGLLGSNRVSFGTFVKSPAIR